MLFLCVSLYVSLCMSLCGFVCAFVIVCMCHCMYVSLYDGFIVCVIVYRTLCVSFCVYCIRVRRNNMCIILCAGLCHRTRFICAELCVYMLIGFFFDACFFFWVFCLLSVHQDLTILVFLSNL